LGKRLLLKMIRFYSSKRKISTTQYCKTNMKYFSQISNDLVNYSSNLYLVRLISISLCLLCKVWMLLLNHKNLWWLEILCVYPCDFGDLALISITYHVEGNSDWTHEYTKNDSGSSTETSKRSSLTIWLDKVNFIGKDIVSKSSWKSNWHQEGLWFAELTWFRQMTRQVTFVYILVVHC
jgi:hypothetical protein